MTSEKLKLLNARLTEDVKEIILEVQGDELTLWPEDVRIWMAEVLADSVIRRTMKFYRGQKEHGGNFLTKDMRIVNMIQEENDDSFWYFERFKHDVAVMVSKSTNTKKL